MRMQASLNSVPYAPHLPFTALALAVTLLVMTGQKSASSTCLTAVLEMHMVQKRNRELS